VPSSGTSLAGITAEAVVLFGVVVVYPWPLKTMAEPPDASSQKFVPVTVNVKSVKEPDVLWVGVIEVSVGGGP
jgi:hypothetical protein